MQPPSARQAACLLAGMRLSASLTPAARISAGEEERLELVDALASRMHHCDAADLAVCRRLLEHLRGPYSNQILSLQ
jgi:hypothetical protein